MEFAEGFRAIGFVDFVGGVWEPGWNCVYCKCLRCSRSDIGLHAANFPRNKGTISSWLTLKPASCNVLRAASSSIALSIAS